MLLSNCNYIFSSLSTSLPFPSWYNVNRSGFSSQCRPQNTFITLMGLTSTKPGFLNFRESETLVPLTVKSMTCPAVWYVSCLRSCTAWWKCVRKFFVLKEQHQEILTSFIIVLHVQIEWRWRYGLYADAGRSKNSQPPFDKYLLCRFC